MRNDVLRHGYRIEFGRGRIDVRIGTQCPTLSLAVGIVPVPRFEVVQDLVPPPNPRLLHEVVEVTS